VATPLALFSRSATGPRLTTPRSGLERSDFVHRPMLTCRAGFGIRRFEAPRVARLTRFRQALEDYVGNFHDRQYVFDWVTDENQA
jgi:hypothetical protein